jgi:hypothetical protein
VNEKQLGLKYNISSDILNAYSAELGEINNFGGSVNPMNAPSEGVTLATKGHTGAIDQANTAWNVSCSRISITIHIFIKNSPGIESDWNNLCNNVIKYSNAVVASRSGGGVYIIIILISVSKQVRYRMI